MVVILVATQIERMFIPKEHCPDCSCLLKVSVMDVHEAVKSVCFVIVTPNVMSPFSLCIDSLSYDVNE